MFNDSLISLMIMLLLCFMGMLVMFLFVIRSLSVQTASLREGFARQQSTLADLEQQIMDMNFALRRMQKNSGFEGVPEGAGALNVSAPGAAPAMSRPEAPAVSAAPKPQISAAQAPLAVAAPGAASGDLGELFGNSAPGMSGSRKEGADPAKEYSYPSAAGFGPLEDELYNISLSPAPGGRGKADEGSRPAGLDIKLGR